MNFRTFLPCCAAFCLMLILSACNSYYVIPDASEKANPDAVDLDYNGAYILRLADNCNGVEYRDFIIRRDPKAPAPFKIYVHLNSSTFADWRVEPRQFGGQSLVCRVRRITLPPQSLPKKLDQQALGAFCAARYVGDPSVASISTNPATFCGKKAVSYVVRIMPANGAPSLIHGIVVFDDVDLGVILDVNYTQTENGEYSAKLREYGEQFLQSVELKNK